MFRNPFVWKVQVRREVLDDEIGRLRELPYSVWRGMMGRAMVKTANGRDNRTYRIRTHAVWASPGSEDVRVIVSLESRGLRRRLMNQSFVITADNQFLD
jgi:hypothetical protein